MSKAVSRIDKLESFWTQRLKEVFFTDSINTVAGKFFTALIDKEAVVYTLANSVTPLCANSSRHNTITHRNIFIFRHAANP